MQDGDRHWLRTELDECIDSWRGAIDNEGPRSEAALVWQGRADQALRVALHFGVVQPEEGRRRVSALAAEGAVLRALSEPDGDQDD